MIDVQASDFVTIFHTIGWFAFEIPKWLSIGLIIVIFILSCIYARKHGPRDITGFEHELEQEATVLLQQESEILEKDVTK